MAVRKGPPLNAFCCGCSLSFGTAFIAALNIIQAVVFIATSVLNLLFRSRAGFLSQTELAIHILNAFFALGSLPFAVLGFGGVLWRQSGFVMLYFWFLLLALVIDLLYLGFGFAVFDPCQTMNLGIGAKTGAASQCGFARGSMIILLLVATALQMYAIAVVYSCAQELKNAGIGFPELLSKRPRKDPAGDVPGDAKYPSYGASYSAQMPKVGGSSRIFGGSIHEVRYPPPPPKKEGF
uniref:Uncharacterized protein n=1 Tax=Chromera velia CCMP2878 TaxID=1169474 RepID=A0A0G4HSU6_9ALVE|eukprot:Cvel_31195.t1-p1 / transcript=Cvel_31195.t1 / gene=Cvel_31195 / organism=Chromera_velia_CCMP2878 / gene_product=hypothetical protein / transcript_product=hypothetical protein / location=Cvel_scaffold4601:1933-5739(+) / protein_length=236 / sequence_SO=supercontig / SO=protein_coding / is_pseudo=false